MSRDLLLYGRRSGDDRVVIVSNGTSALAQSAEPQLGLALEDVIKDLKGVGIEKMCSLDEAQKPVISLLDGWTGGRHFIAWKSRDGKSIVLLVTSSISVIQDDLEGVKDLVADGVCLNKGNSHKHGEYKITNASFHEANFFSLRMTVAPKNGNCSVSYIGIGESFSSAICGVARIIPGG